MPLPIGEFLQARRAMIDPESLGIVTYGRRRVAGLRREELAALAGVSPEHYARIEQGRVHPSPEMLDAIARALGLEEAERAHLHALAGTSRRRRSAPPVASPSLHRLVDGLAGPAYLLGPRTEVVGFNRLAEEVIFPFSRVPARERFMIRLVFLEPLMRERHRDWDEMAERTVGFFRADLADDPEDRVLQALAGELTARSPEFAALWAAHHVREKSSGRKQLAHEEVGDYELDFDTLRLVQNPSLRLVAFSAALGSAGDTALKLLSVRIAGEALDDEGRRISR